MLAPLNYLVEAGEGRTVCYRNYSPQPSGAAGFGGAVLLALVYAASSVGGLTDPSEQLFEQFLKKKQLIPALQKLLISYARPTAQVYCV